MTNPLIRILDNFKKLKKVTQPAAAETIKIKTDDVNKRSSNAPLRIQMYCTSHTGYVRKHNEDNFLIGGKYMPMDHQSLEQPIYLNLEMTRQIPAAVFDGMGGESAGELASFIGAYELADLGEFQSMTDDYFTRIIRELNNRVYQSGILEKYSQIGSTLSMIIFQDKMAHVCNVGDSPIYRFREGVLSQISAMHTNADFLKEMGITNRKPGLTQFLGISEEEFLLEPEIKHMEIKRKDFYLICSDGLTDMVTNETIAMCLSGVGTVEEKTEFLKNEALAHGGKDNITIILCEIV